MKRTRPQSGRSEPKGRATALAEAEAAYQQRAWSDAYLAFERAEADAALDDSELEKMAWAASLSGRDSEALAHMERLYQNRLAAEQLPGAARMAFWMGVLLQGMREATQASAWFQRGQRVLSRASTPCAEQGYLLSSAIHRRLLAGDSEGAYADAAEAVAIGERFGEPDLIALGRQLQGRALVRAGQIERGLDLLDEVMLAGTRGELSPTVTGIIYCGVMACFQQVFALKRAQEWTSALAAWCDAQPQLVPFAGACLVHRVEILELCGQWQRASEEALRCLQRSQAPAASDAIGDAHYQRAEIARLRGHQADAEELYRLASERGREPQPGLALLRLAQGEHAAAQSALRRVLAATSEPLRRAQYLPAFIETILATGELEEAKGAARELDALAARVGGEVLAAMAAHARGAVALADGDASAAVGPLRASFLTWQQLPAPISRRAFACSSDARVERWAIATVKRSRSTRRARCLKNLAQVRIWRGSMLLRGPAKRPTRRRPWRGAGTRTG